MATTGTRSPPQRRSPLPSPTAVHERSPYFSSKAASAPKPVASSPPPPAAAASAEDPDTASSDVIIDMDTFQQLLDLEEDDGYDFSIGMTQAYFSQAETTFKDMDQALEAKDLKKLSDLGHFLKGSSAALGVHKVQESCERMQNYGKLLDDKNVKTLKEEDALERITTLLGRVKGEYTEAEGYLKDWYTQHGASV